ncbi:MAG TPA: hypothetical protein VHA35_07920 [Dongiaceae bacterium]|nr:hypothetical protein [Dongiaceae bacterium]
MTILPALVLAAGLAACLSSDPPRLDAGDLATPDGFAGTYFASAVGARDDRSATATIAPAEGNSYLLTIVENGLQGAPDAPVRLRLLRLNSGLLLAVVSDPDKVDDVLYAIVTQAANGAWAFRPVDLAGQARDRRLSDAIRRHGATEVSYDTSDLRADRIQGNLDAANLRALFSDPDFVKAIETQDGFRLSPKP